MQVENPKCCGKEMQRVMETQRFMEMNCELCGDVVYIKKQLAARPQMLDD